MLHFVLYFYSFFTLAKIYLGRYDKYRQNFCSTMPKHVLWFTVFTLPDLDSDSNSDSKPNGYFVICKTFHIAWSRIQIPIPTTKYRNGIRIGI